MDEEPARLEVSWINPAIVVGLRELRQHASDIVRRVEEGEEIVVSVSGRPSARLIPIQRQQWRSHADIQELFETEADPGWERDRELIDQGMRDPWGET